MSSIYRDIAQSMESIYRDLADKPLEDLTKEELVDLLQSVKEEAKSSYISYSVHLGWYPNAEEAENELVGDDDEVDYSEYPVFQFHLTDWISKQKQLSSTTLTAHLIRETDKSFEVFITSPIEDVQKTEVYLPKSQITHYEEIEIFDL